MAEVVLFHHARGLTPDVLAFADELRRAGPGIRYTRPTSSRVVHSARSRRGWPMPGRWAFLPG